MLVRFQNRIREKSENPSSAPVLLVALGDSVTQGCMKDSIDHEKVYHNQLKKILEKEYPKATFSVINAGVGGETASGGLKRLERDVIRHDPDLVLIGFCLNDSGGGKKDLPEFVNRIETIIDEVQSKTKADLILLTPNYMASRVSPSIPEKYRGKTAESLIARQLDGTLLLYVSALRELAIRKQVFLADVYAEWEAMEKRGEDTTMRLCNGLNHPDVSGQALIAATVMRLIV